MNNIRWRNYLWIMLLVVGFIFVMTAQDWWNNDPPYVRANQEFCDMMYASGSSCDSSIRTFTTREDLQMIIGMGVVGAGMMLVGGIWGLRKIARGDIQMPKVKVTPRSPSGVLNIEVELKKLEDMKQRGVISEDEYRKMRSNLISRS